MGLTTRDQPFLALPEERLPHNEWLAGYEPKSPWVQGRYIPLSTDQNPRIVGTDLRH